MLLQYLLSYSFTKFALGLSSMLLSYKVKNCHQIICFLATGTRTIQPNQYWVPRIQVMFTAEDPLTFAQTVARAHRDRKHTEAHLRYNLYVDCMPMEGLVELDPESLKRMVDWAKGAPSLIKDKR